MAIKLKTTKTYTPEMETRMGVNMTNGDYYGVVDRVEYDKSSQECYFAVEIYGTKDSRDAEGLVVDRINFSFSDTDFEIQIGTDGLSISKAYSLALETMTDWESDE